MMLRREVWKVCLLHKVIVIGLERIFLNENNLLVAAKNIKDVELLKTQLRDYAQRVAEFER